MVSCTDQACPSLRWVRALVAYPTQHSNACLPGRQHADGPPLRPPLCPCIRAEVAPEHTVASHRCGGRPLAWVGRPWLQRSPPQPYGWVDGVQYNAVQCSTSQYCSSSWIHGMPIRPSMFSSTPAQHAAPFKCHLQHNQLVCAAGDHRAR